MKHSKFIGYIVDGDIIKSMENQLKWNKHTTQQTEVFMKLFEKELKNNTHSFVEFLNLLLRSKEFSDIKDEDYYTQVYIIGRLFRGLYSNFSDNGVIHRYTLESLNEKKKDAELLKSQEEFLRKYTH